MFWNVATARSTVYASVSLTQLSLTLDWEFSYSCVCVCVINLLSLEYHIAILFIIISDKKSILRN